MQIIKMFIWRIFEIGRMKHPLQKGDLNAKLKQRHHYKHAKTDAIVSKQAAPWQAWLQR
jgi:hypothetical protein